MADMSHACHACNEILVHHSGSRFCYHCGARLLSRCEGCGKELAPQFKFCPSCGRPSRPESHPSPVSDQKQNKIKLEDVKEKLRKLREKRLAPAERHGAPSSKKPAKDYQEPGPSHSKPTYILVCGIKTFRSGEWVQIKGKSSPYNHSAIKKMFPKAANYYEVLEILKTEFGCDDDACENVLLDMNNREIESPDDFTILEYIKSHKKYAGTTRIYLGVRESVANDEIKDAETPSSETDPSSERDDHTSESTESKSERDDQTSKSTDPKSERDDQTSESTEDGHLLASSSEETRDDYFKDVLDFVREEQQEERKRGIMDLDGGERFDIDTRIFCPVHAVNPKVILFQEKNGNKYKKITNAYGDFFCIPQDDMEEFDRFCKTLNVNQLFIVNPPLLYYLHYVHKSENPNVQVAETASKEVWKISEDIAQSFIEWKASIASIC